MTTIINHNTSKNIIKKMTDKELLALCKRSFSHYNTAFQAFKREGYYKRAELDYSRDYNFVYITNNGNYAIGGFNAKYGYVKKEDQKKYFNN